ncbi:hypothetical protein [Morganella psychrotolerans]|uniref:hypothetical protein n=1 Tax=Morganella psychrotolerans TaxID=368603 RepID=UPI0039AFF9CC
MADNIALNHERIVPGVPEENYALREDDDSAAVQPVAGQYDNIILERESRERLETITDELSEIKTMLYSNKSSDAEIEIALARYKLLMSKDNIVFIQSIDRKWSDDAIYINNRIHDFEISKELITHEYYDEQLHILVRYSHDISLKYHREGMSGYMEFYKGTTKILNDYGNYIGDVVDDGKKTLLKEHKLINDLHSVTKKYIPDLDTDTGFIYKSNIEVVPGKKNGLYNVAIDGQIIESDVSYKSAVTALNGFFSVFDKPINGTKFIKQIIPEKDKDGNVIKLTGKVRQFVVPDNVFTYLEINNYAKDYESNVSGSLSEIHKLNIFTNNEHVDAINEMNLNEYTGLKEKIKDALDNSRISSSGSHITIYRKIAYDYDGWKAKIIVRYEEISKSEYDKYMRDDPDIYIKTWAKWKPTVDTKQVVLNIDTSVKVDSTALNILTTRLDGMKKELQLSIDEFSQHYSTKNSNYENMVKNITNMISDLFNEIKNMLRN